MERIKSSLHGILKWSLRQQQEDNSRSATVDSVDHEKNLKWLSEVFDELNKGPSETQLLKTAISVLEYHSGGSLGKKEKCNVLESFEHIEYLVEDLDHASDLIPLNGIDVITKYLYSDDSELICASCSIIITACQNHHTCQQAFCTISTVQQLMKLVTNANQLQQIKALSALSSIIRGYDIGKDMFINQDGLEVLLVCLKSDSTKLVTKTCFFLSSLYFEPHSKLEEYSFNFSQTILGNLSGTDSDHRDYIEQSLTAVKAILDRYPSHKELLTSHRDTLQRLLHTTVNEEEETKVILKELIGE